MRISIVKDKLSDVGISMGQVFFAAILIQPLILGEISVIKITSGVLLSVICFGIGALNINNTYNE